MYDIEQVKSIYDELTSKIKSDLDEQFTLGRITGSEYANVYSQLMNQCLQLAFQAPLSDIQVEKTKKEIDLIEQQINLTKNQADDVKTRTELIINETEAKIKSINADTENKITQNKQIEAQIELIKKQVEEQDYITTHIRPSEAKLNELKSNEILHNINLIDAQIENVNADKNIKNKQLDSINQDIIGKQIENEYKPNILNAELENKISQTDLIKVQKDLTNKQIDETIQKITSMQVADSVKQVQSDKDALLKDAQREVYLRQKQGFDDKMKMDLTKMQLDAWSMMFSSGLMCDDDGNCTLPDMIKNDELTTLYNKIKETLGIS